MSDTMGVNEESFGARAGGRASEALARNRFESTLETIGGTPVVRIRQLAPAHVSLYAKVEAFNPMGSVKDRLTLGVIEDAAARESS